MKNSARVACLPCIIFAKNILNLENTNIKNPNLWLFLNHEMIGEQPALYSSMVILAFDEGISRKSWRPPVCLPHYVTHLLYSHVLACAQHFGSRHQ